MKKLLQKLGILKKSIFTPQELEVLQGFIDSTYIWQQEMQKMGAVTGFDDNCPICGVSVEKVTTLSKSLKKLLSNKKMP